MNEGGLGEGRIEERRRKKGVLRRMVVVVEVRIILLMFVYVLREKGWKVRFLECGVVEYCYSNSARAFEGVIEGANTCPFFSFVLVH